MVGVVDVSQDEVVEDEAVPLTIVNETLMIVEVMLDDEGLGVWLDDDVYPADDVFLLDGDIIKDGDVL